jgi:hypothetical protein
MRMGKWQETIGHGFGTGRRKGTTKRTPVTNEVTGGIGGYQTEHWDDRVDAEVRPDTVQMKMGFVQGGEGS